MNRVGILGGTFDPPHNAHLAMAGAALERVPLDKVLFMPAPLPPQKVNDEITRYEDRVEMVRLAIGKCEGIELSLLEEFRTGPSYTVDLIEHFRSSEGNDPYLIVGADSVRDLPDWKDPEKLLLLSTLVVFPRTGYRSCVPVRGEASIILFDWPVIDISSTDIRKRISNGEDVRSDIPEAVYDFILDNGLYT